MDELSQHTGCRISLDADITVIYCEDGYIAIDSTYDYLNSLTQVNSARTTLKYTAMPKDV